MPIRIVQSKQNARVKDLRTALQRPGKGSSARADSVAIEGIHLLEEVILSGVAIETVFVAQGHESLLDELGLPDSADVLALPADLLASAVTTEAPQPVAALVRPRDWGWDDLIGKEKKQERQLILVLAGIQDPGNLGTILRSAEAFAATGVVCLPGTVSRWNPKALRASAGSAFRMPLVAASSGECFAEFKRAEISTLAAMPHEARPLGEHDLAGPVALFLGSEGTGLPDDIAARCDARITIPCPGPVESLNAAVAGSILLYEAARQRQSSSAGGS